MSIFRFKYFSVENTESAMKVNTDGVLLGALMTVRPEDRNCLDVGTGTGTVALMAAQRMSFIGAGSDGACSITGIDIDGASAHEAGLNFAASPWPGMLRSLHLSLSDFAVSAEPHGFDHIFSNPPYYDLSLSAPDARRNAARHTDSLSYREITAFAAESLAPDGLLSLILPADSGTWLLRHAAMNGLHLFRMVRIRTSVRKKPSRIVAEFSRRRQAKPVQEELAIQDGPDYTPEYLALTSDFYIR